jgi:hypothetical protein
VASDPIVKEIYIDAPPSVVFQFLTDPQKMLSWMGIRAEIDPKPGGIYRVDANGRDVILGEYLEVVADSRVDRLQGLSGPVDKAYDGIALEFGLRRCIGPDLLRPIDRDVIPYNTVPIMFSHRM